MMTHQHPPELTGVDLPGIDPMEKESFDEMLVKNALRIGAMNKAQLQDCVREKQVMESLGARQTMSQICVRKGYLSQEQVAQIMRQHRYEKLRHEDLEIGRAAVKHELVPAEQVRACLRIQELAYQQGQTTVPRLMHLLGDRGLLDGRKAMTLLDAVYMVDRRGLAQRQKKREQQWAWDQEVKRKQQARRIIQRGAERFNVPDAYVRYRSRFLFSSSEESELTPLIDVSTTGLQFLNRDKLKVDQRLQLELLLPAFSDKVRVKGNVRWLGRAGLTALYRVGVRFHKLDKEIKHTLEQLADDPFLRATGRSPYRVYW